MDYLVIGSNGFAQVGDADFHNKNFAEMRILLKYLNINYPIPEEFFHMCEYQVKWFHHEFRDYSEIVLVYNDRILDDWDENDPEKFERFWEWFNKVEMADLETETLTSVIKASYSKTINYYE